MNTEPCKQAGSRKYRGYIYTTACALAVFGGGLFYCHATKQPVDSIMPLVTAVLFSIGSTFGIFSGSNAVVHATTKDKTA
jgi:hypothetical protein